MRFEDIRIYNKDFELISILPKYISVNWEIKFSEFGLGEIELEKTEEIVSLLTENKYLFMFQGDIQSIVTGYKIAETVTVFTRTLEWLLTKFSVKKFSVKEILYNSNDIWNSTELIKYVLKNNLHSDFNLEFLGLEEDDTDMTDFEQNSLSDVYSVIKEIITDKKLGFKFYRDFKDERFVFLMLRAQENKDVVLCDEYKTSYESEYIYDLQKETSGGIYYHELTDMGEWNANTNTPELGISPSNYGKYYTVSTSGTKYGITWAKGDIAICKNLNGMYEKAEKAEPFLVEIPPEENGIFSWSIVLDSKNSEDVKKELEERKTFNQLTCKTILSYPDDFKLGDIIVTKFFAKDLSSEKKKLIKEIHLWDEPDDSGAMPTTIDIT